MRTLRDDAVRNGRVVVGRDTGRATRKELKMKNKLRREKGV